MKLLSVAVGLALLTSAGAEAAGYVGLRFGTEMKDRFDDLVGNQNIDTKLPLAIFGGLRFEEHFAIEASYTNLGTSKSFAIADAGFDLDGKLFTLSGQYHFPVNETASIYAGLGAFNLNEDGSSQSIIGPRPLKHNDSGLFGEIGARFVITDPLSIRISYQRYDFEGGGDGSLNAGLAWEFE
jgi:opacity protein-like surface antigen